MQTILSMMQDVVKSSSSNRSGYLLTSQNWYSFKDKRPSRKKEKQARGQTKHASLAWWWSPFWLVLFWMPCWVISFVEGLDGYNFNFILHVIQVEKNYCTCFFLSNSECTVPTKSTKHSPNLIFYFEVVYVSVDDHRIQTIKLAIIEPNKLKI